MCANLTVRNSWGHKGFTFGKPPGFILSNQENFPVALVGKGKSKLWEMPVPQGKDLHSAISHWGQGQFSYSAPVQPPFSPPLC